MSKDGVRPDPQNVEKIVNWPKPQNAKQVKQFVATGSYYRRFIQDYAKTALPLIELTKLGREFSWGESCEQAFTSIKQALISPAVMGYPMNNAGQFLLDVDASGLGIGGVLAQVQDGRERVIAYASRAMNTAERNYCITEKELLAVVYFVQYFRQYLLGRRFRVRTDHQALVWLFRLKEPSGKIARWIEILAPYDFEIEYRPGKKQSHCDALSRCPTPRDCRCDDVDMSEPLKCGPCRKCKKRAEDMDGQAVPNGTTDSGEQPTKSDDANIRAVIQCRTEKTGTGDNTNWWGPCSKNTMATSQLKDPDIGFLLTAVTQGDKPSSRDMLEKSQASRHYWILWETLVVKEDVLYRVFRKSDGTDEYRQLIVPHEYKNGVVSLAHDSVIGGHMVIRKTKAKILTHFYWYNLKDNVKLLFVVVTPVLLIRSYQRSQGLLWEGCQLERHGIFWQSTMLVLSPLLHAGIDTF